MLYEFKRKSSDTFVTYLIELFRPTFIFDEETERTCINKNVDQFYHVQY